VRWDAAELARVAGGAGFAGDALVTATALALATSGGLDSYRFRPGSPGSGDYRGLWGVDVDRYPDLAGRPLEVPRVNAATAYELWRDVRGFGWSPWWSAGQWQHWQAHAGTARTRTYAAQPLDRPVTVHTSGDRFAATLDRIRQGRGSGLLHTIEDGG